MFILRLYVLDGCPSCQQAVQFIQSRRLPCEVIIANNDPIIKSGNEALNKSDNYPILLYNTTKEMIVGFKEDAYSRICEAANILFGGGAWRISNNPEHPDGESQTPPTENSTGTN